MRSGEKVLTRHTSSHEITRALYLVKCGGARDHRARFGERREDRHQVVALERRNLDDPARVTWLSQAKADKGCPSPVPAAWPLDDAVDAAEYADDDAAQCEAQLGGPLNECVRVDGTRLEEWAVARVARFACDKGGGVNHRAVATRGGCHSSCWDVAPDVGARPLRPR